jgi:hypothetical protein
MADLTWSFKSYIPFHKTITDSVAYFNDISQAHVVSRLFVSTANVLKVPQRKEILARTVTRRPTATVQAAV